MGSSSTKRQDAFFTGGPPVCITRHPALRTKKISRQALWSRSRHSRLLTCIPNRLRCGYPLYIELGKPVEQGKMQSALLAQAAGALLSSGKSASLQDDLKKRFGIDTFNVDSQGGDFRNSIVSVGKYLTPDLYVSIGRSIFTGDNQFTVTYSLSKNWEVQSKTGNESGATLLLVKVR